MITIHLSFQDEDESLIRALAQASKRFSSTIAIQLAADKKEANRITKAMEVVREGLADAGYAPR